MSVGARLWGVQDDTVPHKSNLEQLWQAGRCYSLAAIVGIAPADAPPGSTSAKTLTGLLRKGRSLSLAAGPALLALRPSALIWFLWGRRFSSGHCVVRGVTMSVTRPLAPLTYQPGSVAVASSADIRKGVEKLQKWGLGKWCSREDAGCG